MLPKNKAGRYYSFFGRGHKGLDSRRERLPVWLYQYLSVTLVYGLDSSKIVGFIIYQISAMATTRMGSDMGFNCDDVVVCVDTFSSSLVCSF